MKRGECEWLENDSLQLIRGHRTGQREGRLVVTQATACHDESDPLPQSPHGECKCALGRTIEPLHIVDRDEHGLHSREHRQNAH